MDRRYIGMRNIILFLLVNGLYGCAAGHLSSEQQAAVDRMHQSTFDLPDHARRVTLSPRGILEVETTESQDAYDNGNGQRTLIDLRSKARIWSGPIQNSYMITDAPSPILVTKDSDKYTLRRYNRQGKPVWKNTGKGLFVFGLGVEESGILLVLSLQQTGKNSVRAFMDGIRPNNGKRIWRKGLGKVSLSDKGAGSLWRYNNRPVFAYKGKAFLLLEDRAICLSVTNGRIYSNWKVPRHEKSAMLKNVMWFPLSKDVVVVSGADVIVISGSKTRNRYIGVGKGYAATDAVLRGKDLIIAFNGEEKRGVGVLALGSGKWRWKKSWTDEESNVAPRGIVVVGNKLAVASKGSLHGFNLANGSKRYTIELPKKYLQGLYAYGNNMIVLGTESIESRSVSSGKLKWSREKLGTPLALHYSNRTSSMAVVQASMQASANISANASRSYYGMANKKIGGSYAYDPWTRSQYSRLSSSAGRSAATSGFGASMVGGAQASSSGIDRMVSIIVAMQTEEPLKKKWAYYVVPMKSGTFDYQTNTAKLLAVRLSDGATREVPLKEASMTCIPTAMVSVSFGLIIQAYNKFPFCEQSQTIDVMSLPRALK